MSKTLTAILLFVTCSHTVCIGKTARTVNMFTRALAILNNNNNYLDMWALVQLRPYYSHSAVADLPPHSMHGEKKLVLYYSIISTQVVRMSEVYSGSLRHSQLFCCW